MCKSIEYVNSINETYKSIIEDFEKCKRKTSILDQAEQDILHFIESGINFDEENGLKTVIALKTLRKERRKNKDKSFELYQLIKNLKAFQTNLEEDCPSLKANSKTTKGYDNYKLKVLENDDNILKETRKLLTQMKYI